MGLPQIIAALGGTTVLIYILILVFAPSLLLIITPLLTNLINGVSGLIKYLWGAFLYTSQSVPACLLLIFVALFAFNTGSYHGTKKTWTKVHTNYTLTNKRKTKSKLSDDSYELFTKPLDLFR